MMKDSVESSHLFAGNAPFVEGLYDDYLADPQSVTDEWRRFFDGIEGKQPSPSAPPPPRAQTIVSNEAADVPRRHETKLVPASDGVPPIPAVKQSGIRQLILAYRLTGHLAANVDPIQLQTDPRQIKSLALSEHGLSEDDLETVFDTGNMWGPTEATLREILDVLQRTYTRSISSEYTHINDLEQRNWIRERLERTQAQSTYSNEFRKELLQRISAAEGIERFLHTRYSGQKRFSLEGGESLIPLLDTLIDRCGANDVKELALGMAHRGRLNVLVHIMGKQPKDLFLQFEGKYEAAERGSGDVKYHEGYSSNVITSGGPIHIAMAFNPSHLEIIDPVVEGSVRARQDRRKDKNRNKVLPILIHGDAAIAGQGVVYETFNLAQTRGFTTGGTIHLVINNQIGFTLSNPLDSRSTLYCTDIAKVVQSPIFHVNADDPEAVVYVAQLAVDYRLKFGKDVLIDLVCYRRHGHNEADEPAATQPKMYERIRRHPTTRELYAEHLIGEGVCSPQEAEQYVQEYRARLEAGENVAPNFDPEFSYPYIADWSHFVKCTWDTPAATRVQPEMIRRLGEQITTVPEDFELHPRVRKIIDDRRKMIAGALPLDWGCAENLAYATLLDQGYAVRLTGQDSGRGTFFHRHAALHNQRTGETLIPLKQLADDQPLFTIVDSILSEEAVLAFEYGYSTTDPDTLVIWEAQFGDFMNGAQVVIDQFLSSSEQKWRRLCGLVLMLPHGWEGQGPEHSSARLERFMLLCAEDNMQVVNPTTPAQMFHLLRREMIRPYRKPLIIMSPKSTLRRKISFSSIDDLTEVEFQLVIDETGQLDMSGLRRVVLCSGKVYYDLYEERERRGIRDIALVRVEQLYPFPDKTMEKLLSRYAGVDDLTWCQEEPRNQGAWYGVKHDIRRCKQPHQTLRYAGRPRSAAPAGGDIRRHRERQQKLIDDALNIEDTPDVRILSDESKPRSVAAK